MKERNILFIVEGKDAEPNLIKQYFHAYYGITKNEIYEIHSVKTNIYSLYNELKSEDFFLNIREVLLQKSKTNEETEILQKKYLYTYLIFDCDAHNVGKNNTLTIEEIVRHNFSILKEMSEYFNDESDPTKGKLYINYPMLESYRDCNDFFDENYKFNTVKINDLLKYKSIVGKKKLCNQKNLSKYNFKDFNLLTKMNLYKLNFLFNNNWDSFNYEEYLNISNCFDIVNKEKDYVSSTNSLMVLNTFLFWLIDYYGSKTNIFDSIINQE